MFFLLCLTACRAEPRPGDPLRRAPDAIQAAGRLFHAGTPVVLWYDPGGYDAYRAHCRFQPGRAGPLESPGRLARYDSFRGGLPADISARVAEDGWKIEDLKRVIHQIVIHFDACGTSRKCFEVLQDVRGLSCHFLLDLDGTVYQSLDLKDRAWHAGKANSFSVGIEIANIGAYQDAAALSRWYAKDGSGVKITVPPDVRAEGIRQGFVGRPRRPDPLKGRINGRDLLQYDLTEEQYAALERLLIALCRIFPEVKARAPVDGRGKLLDHVLASDEEITGFHGLLGHFHVEKGKVDPGPAFDWDRILGALRRAGIPPG
jgi:N-acetyl-anhydromuramyl-L-alanine amidase AmpD